MTGSPRPPNLLLLITDQQRAPMHWPEEPGWLDALMPADAELRRTGVSFERTFVATCMCSPSRASFFTGTFPSRHGVGLTLTLGDLWPDPHNIPDVLRTAADLMRTGDAPRGRLARTFGRTSLRLGPKSGREPELAPAVPTIARMLRARGYEVVLKGKWHLSKAVGAEFGPADSRRLARDYGFAGWEPPDAGGDAKAKHFGGGNAGTSGLGWDEDYTRQALAWLGQADLPEPFCLIVSLINPHDVLGYPAQYEAGGYDAAEFRDLGVGLPPTIDESLRDKPGVQSLATLGQVAYMGALHDARARLDYVNFYAYLHRLVDEKLGRVMGALGDADDPGSLRSRTVIARFSDHGELGLSHGGLRQKMFNAYEETIRVPLVISNPVLFPGGGAATDRLASLVDVVPTLLSLAGADSGGAPLDGHDLVPVLAHHADPDRDALSRVPVALDRVTDAESSGTAVREAVLFTYDDHQAGTAFQEAPGQPNRIRCVRDARWKYAVYLDPTGRARPEYECYDLEADPAEAHNLVDKSTGEGRTPDAERERRRLHERLAVALEETGTVAPALPAAG